MSAAAAIAPATAKTVLVVENEDGVRSPLVKALQYRGFQARGAANVTETRHLLDKLGPQIDVAVLDMRLEDQNYPDMTGAALGQEMRKGAHPSPPPEFLIFSGFSELDFYSEAVELGTAAYLHKATVTQDDLIRHIRSLALRRALNDERQEIAGKIERIAEKEYSRTEAVRELCSQVIEPELNACLGVPAVFLLSDAKGTQNCGGGAGLLAGYHPVYGLIQELTFGSLNTDAPFVLSPENLRDAPGGEDPAAADLLRRLEGASFIPLHSARDLRLSLGVLRAGDDALAEEPQDLAAVLNTYIRRSIYELMDYLSRMEVAIENARRRTLLEHTSRFCIFVGQTQLDVLNEAVANREIDPADRYFRRLKKLASDLNATGKEFSQLNRPAGPPAARPVNVSPIVRRAVEEIEGQFLFEDMELVERNPEESFELAVEQEDLFIAVLRMLQWMAQREEKIPPDVSRPRIEVAYVSGEDRREIHFSDQSRRLGPELRKKLFDPFTQTTTPTALMKDEGDDFPGLYLPLYLAKMIVEKKGKGSLEDHTDELEGGHGHLFVMSFPAGGSPPAASDTA